MPKRSSSVENLVEDSVDVTGRFSIHSHSKERSDMMHEEELRDTCELAGQGV